MTAYFAAQPQTYFTPYQQQPRRIFGQPLQLSRRPQLVLDESFRAAAKEDPRLRGFMQSVDQMAAKYRDEN